MNQGWTLSTRLVLEKEASSPPHYLFLGDRLR